MSLFGIDPTETADILEANGDIDASALIRRMDADNDRLTARLTELEKAAEQIHHLHKDSPMGPCPVCIDSDAMARGGDGTMPYPCPTARLAGATDCDPPSSRVVAYRSPGTRTLYCVTCARREEGWQPITADQVRPDTKCNFCGGRVMDVASRTLGEVVARHLHQAAEAQQPSA